MTKLDVQIHNTRFQLEFEYRENLDNFVEYLRASESPFADHLNKIADALEKESYQTNSKDDLKLIPEIIEAINTHVKNVGDLNKLGSSMTGWVATELIYNKDTDEWITDNGYIMSGSLVSNLYWLKNTAPEYWGKNK